MRSGKDLVLLYFIFYSNGYTMVSIFSHAGSIARVRAFYGRGNGPIVLDNLFCNGREASLFHCPFVTNPRFKSHAEDAGVQCFLKG